MSAFAPKRMDELIGGLNVAVVSGFGLIAGAGAKRLGAHGIDEADTDVTMLSQMLGDTLQGIDQMRELVENLRDFTRLDRAKVAEFMPFGLIAQRGETTSAAAA